MPTKEQFKQAINDVRANQDLSHLEPPPARLYYARANWEKMRIEMRPRCTASLAFVPDIPLHPFFNS